jgi:hypothetical protein
MPVSAAIRKYYAEKIFAEMGRDKAPANFRPLPVPAHGLATVEGCRGGGKNILELTVLLDPPTAPGGPGGPGGGISPEGRRVDDVRVSCGLCNPAMYAGADVVVEWARGRALAEVLALEPLRVEALAPFFARLGGPGRPDDAREKFQYALIALQNAVRSALGRAPLPAPAIDGPTDRDWDAPDA